MLLHQPLKKCDAIFILGSRDERVAEYGASLFLQGYGKWLIISGSSAHHGDLLKVHWQDSSEAEHFADIAARMGVPRERMILEFKATNTGQNILLTYELLRQTNIKCDSLLLVQKPYMERRTYATFMKQWPGGTIDIVVSSPPLAYDVYFDEKNPKEDILNIIVGDLQRIIEYPRLGFQIAQEVPADVLEAWEVLVARGYTKHLLPATR